MERGKETGGLIESLESRVLLSNPTPPVLKDINPAGDSLAANNPTASGYFAIPEHGVQFNGRTYFAADDGVHGSGLWVTDGTESGTQMVVDLVAGKGGSRPISFLVHGDRLFFTAMFTDIWGRQTTGLFKTDGTAAGTVRVTSTQGEYSVRGQENPQMLFEFKGKVAFLGFQSYYQHYTGTSLWLSDGTPGGTHRAGDTISTSTDDPGNLTVSGDYLYFSFHTSAGYASLCRHDGTNWSDVLHGCDPRNMVDLNGALVFSYRPTDYTGTQLWVIDGAGARRIPGGPTTVYPTARLGGRVYFGAYNSGGGYSLWATDGTAANTRLVSGAGAFTLPPRVLRAANGRLWFFAGTAEGEEPWVTDGTAAGTRALGDLNPGAASSIVGGYPGPAHEPFFVGGPDGYVYFQATTAAAGTELFRSDGTAAGTGLVVDFVPGTGDSVPGPFLNAGGRLFVAANNPTFGREWHLIASDTVAPAIVSPVFEFGTRQAVVLPFSEDVGATLDAADLRVVDLDRGRDVPAGEWALSKSAAGAPTVATVAFTAALPDGNYEVRLQGGGVSDAAGNPLGDFRFGFYVLAGDANRDRAIDFNDLVLLAQNYNTAGKTFAEGDFSGDGRVDFGDLVLLAQRYNTTLAAPPAAVAGAPRALAGVRARPTSASLFSAMPVARATYFAPKRRPVLE